MADIYVNSDALHYPYEDYEEIDFRPWMLTFEHLRPEIDFVFVTYPDNTMEKRLVAAVIHPKVYLYRPMERVPTTMKMLPMPLYNAREACRELLNLVRSL